MPISIADPITQSINRAKYLCFQPFNVGRWFIIGFVAWLSMLDQGGNMPRMPDLSAFFPAPAPAPPPPMPGRTPRFPTPTPAPRPGTGGSDPIKWITDWLSAHLLETILIGALIVIAIIAIILLILWLSSRGKLMFIENIATSNAAVVAPWKRYRTQGNSLFLFRALLGAIGSVIFLSILAAAVLIALPDIRDRDLTSYSITAIILFVALMTPIGLFLSLINWVTTTFVPIIMYARGTTVLDAWIEFRTNILRGNIGILILFLIMQIILAIALGVGQMILGCVTCGIGFIPYLSTVVTLPLHVFYRAYPIYFLQQFGPQYAIITEPLPIAHGFPVIATHPAPTPTPAQVPYPYPPTAYPPPSPPPQPQQPQPPPPNLGL